MSSRTDLRRHFEARETLSLPELAREFSVPADLIPELRECLALFLGEFGVPSGLLRRDDSLRVFVEPPPTRNPIKSFFDQAAIQDSVSELNYRLGKRRDKLGRPLEGSPVTVGEFVAAWLGH